MTPIPQQCPWMNAALTKSRTMLCEAARQKTYASTSGDRGSKCNYVMKALENTITDGSRLPEAHHICI